MGLISFTNMICLHPRQFFWVATCPPWRFNGIKEMDQIQYIFASQILALHQPCNHYELASDICAKQ